MGPTVKVEIQDQESQRVFEQLAKAGRNPTVLLQRFGRYGKASTQLRFRTQKGPDGRRWAPSKRAQKEGGQTLRKTSRLRNSISSQLIPGGVEWGTNVVYAGVHQNGFDGEQNVKGHYRVGRRKRATAAGVRIRFAVRPFKRHMRIPARPFLGVNKDDREAFRRLAYQYLQEQSGQRLTP